MSPLTTKMNLAISNCHEIQDLFSGIRSSEFSEISNGLSASTNLLIEDYQPDSQNVITEDLLDDCYNHLQRLSDITFLQTQTKPYALKSSNIKYMQASLYRSQVNSSRWSDASDDYQSTVNIEDYTGLPFNPSEKEPDIPYYSYDSTGKIERRIVNYNSNNQIVDDYFVGSNAVKTTETELNSVKEIYDKADISSVMDILNIKSSEFYDPVQFKIYTGDQLVKWLESFNSITGYMLDDQNVTYNGWTKNTADTPLDYDNIIGQSVPACVADVDMDKNLGVSGDEETYTWSISMNTTGTGAASGSFVLDSTTTSELITLPNAETLTVNLGDKATGMVTKLLSVCSDWDETFGNKIRNTLDGFGLGSGGYSNGYLPYGFLDGDVVTSLDVYLDYPPESSGTCDLAWFPPPEFDEFNESVAYSSVTDNGFGSYTLTCNHVATQDVPDDASATCIIDDNYGYQSQIKSKSGNVLTGQTITFIEDPADSNKNIPKNVESFNTIYKGDSTTLYQTYAMQLFIRTFTTGTTASYSEVSTPQSFIRSKTVPIYLKTTEDSAVNITNVGLPSEAAISIKTIINANISATVPANYNYVPITVV